MTTEAVIIDKRIPDKWRDYKPCGVPIKSERIIAFKTPLSNRYDNESDRDNGIKASERFTPMDLLNHLNQKNWKLGLVVDFTNTFRYYNGKEFSDHGICYRKVKCIGKEIPSEDVVTRFKTEACSFFAKNSTGSLIGVHCTHGLNRAGYIVCRYLIECRGYTPEKAIQAFNEARGYPMERENYLEDLRTKTPKVEELSSIRGGEKRRKQVSPPDRSRLIHTSTRYSRAYQGEEFERMDRGPSRYNRHQNSDFASRSSGYRYRPSYFQTTETRDYKSRRFSSIETRRNPRDFDEGYSNYDNARHEYSYDRHNYRDDTSYNRHDYRPTSSQYGSSRHDRVDRSKPFRNRSAPYSRY